MSKGYWVATYRCIVDPAKVAEYVRLAGPAFRAHGGRYVVRGTPCLAYEAGLLERTVVLEFDSVDAAIKAHDSETYQRALEALGDGAVRDIRIVEAAGL